VANFFGPGFLEKVSKRIEVEKTMDKERLNQKGKPPSKKQKYENNSLDLRSFFGQRCSWPQRAEHQEIQPPAAMPVPAIFPPQTGPAFHAEQSEED